jgi:hypothetical protein
MNNEQTSELVALSDEELTKVSGGKGCRRICTIFYWNRRRVGVRCHKVCW